MKRQAVLLRKGRRVMTGSFASDGPIEDVWIETVAGFDRWSTWAYYGWTLEIGPDVLR